MSDSPAPDLIKVTEIFLVPSSFLVAALGTADTNPHRAAVSVLGLIVSILWWTCSRDAFAEQLGAGVDASQVAPRVRIRIMLWLPQIFASGWLFSLIGHIILWSQPLGS
jgi:hypothetical protein